MVIDVDKYDFELEGAWPQKEWDSENNRPGDEQAVDERTGKPLFQFKVAAYEKSRGAEARPEYFWLKFIPLEKLPELGRHAAIEFERLWFYVSKGGTVVYRADGMTF